MKRAFFAGIVSTCLLAFVTYVSAAAGEPPLEVNKNYDPSKAVPIFLSGYSGEVGTVLKFDLEVAGFRFVEKESADYFLSNGDGSRVEGRLTDRNRQSKFSKAYAGGSARTQAHALADDVVQAVTGKPGIAQTRIAFKVDTGANSEIYVSDYDGHNAVGVTRDNTIVAAPCWGHGKHVLFYTSYKLGDPYIFSQDLATGLREVVSQHPGMNSSVAVSPDGRRLAMILSMSGRPQVHVADADGKNAHQVTSTKTGASSPCWSPDGRICFSSMDSGRSELYVVSAAGGAMQRVRAAGVANATEPDWSPDGTQIVFTTQKGGGIFEIYVVSAKGGDAEFKATGEDPSWASNSRTVVFAKRRKDGSRGLSLLDVPTKQVKDIPKILGSNSQPSWAR